MSAVKTKLGKPLFKSTIVIWSEEDPGAMELDELAREAVSGCAYCSKHRVQRVTEPTTDKDWDGTEFFGVPGDEEEP